MFFRERTDWRWQVYGTFSNDSRIQLGRRDSSEKRRTVISLLSILILVNCQQSPVEPSREITSGGPVVAPGDTIWTGMLEVDLERFATTEELRADRTVFPSENLHPEFIHLDFDRPYTAGRLTRSMRYDWTNQGTKSISIGRGITLPQRVDELWGEFVIRWSRNFTPCNPNRIPCDHKTIFYQVGPSNTLERWSVHVGGGAGESGPAVGVTIFAPLGKVEGHGDWRAWQLPMALRAVNVETRPPIKAANQYFDDEWHVMRMYVRHSSDAETYDGQIKLWMDGELLYDTEQLRSEYGVPGFATAEGLKIMQILLGRNKDAGLDNGTESMWIARVRAWPSNPGW